jgi:large subunit ribosomal protein L23
VNTSHVLLRPIVTEKSTILQEKGKYVFQIAPKATKGDVARAVEKTFGVKVIGVNTIKVHGKMKRFGRKASKQPDFRKAIVALKSGDRIQLFEGA